MKQRHNIQEFIKPEGFKSYDELKKKLEAVLSGDSFSNQTAEELSFENDMPSFSKPALKEAVAKPIASKSASDDDDDTLAYFSKLALED
jgi:hypothetical protein